MPLYSYKCPKPKCLGTHAELRTIEERHDGPLCHCGTKMELQIDPVRGIVKNPAVPQGRR